MSKRRSESGNIFFTLFGAVALVGILGVVTTNLMRGPVGTVMKLNQRAKAESQLQIARKLVALEAAQTSGDCDSDTYLEPIAPDTAGSCGSLGLTGGGCIPSTIGTSQNDPWGTRMGYCAWDHGSVIGSGCSGTLLNGTNSSAKTVIAIISAGPNRTFDSSCADDPSYVTKGGDDIVMEWTYDDAIQGAGGLWKLKSSDSNVASIDKQIEVGQQATFKSGASFANNVSMGSGALLDLYTQGGLLNLPDQNQVVNCNGANTNLVRIDNSTGLILQVCDGSSWVDIGGSGSASAAVGAPGDVQLYSGGSFYGVSNFNYDFANDRLRVGGSTAANDTLEVTGTADISSSLEAEQLRLANGGTAANAGLVFNSAGNLGVYGSGTTLGLTVGGSTKLSVSSASTSITDDLGVGGNTTLSGTLGVTGATTLSSTLDVTGATTLGSTLTVAGNISNGGGDVTVNDNLDVTGSLHVSSTFAAQSFELDTIGSGVGLYQDGASGLELRTGGANRVQIDAAGDIGVGLVSSPTTDFDIGGVIRLRAVGATAGASCGVIGGAITYTSGDELLVCSDITGNWETIGTSGGGGGGGVGGIWERTTGVIRISPTYFSSSDDFVVGSLQLDDTGSGSSDSRMFFDSSLSAFRAGAANGTEWNAVNRGAYSAAMGLNTTASGQYSFAMGNAAQATAGSTLAIGDNAQARATDGIALGRDVTVAAGALNSMGIGLGIAGGATPQLTGTNSLGIFMRDQSGVSFAANNTMGLFGGKLLVDPNAPATQLTTSGSLTVDVEGQVGATNFCNEDGNYCFTAYDVATGSTGAPGSDTQIVYNSSGALYASSGFVYTSSGRLGIGTNAPSGKIQVVGTQNTAIIIEDTGNGKFQSPRLQLMTSGYLDINDYSLGRLSFNDSGIIEASTDGATTHSKFTFKTNGYGSAPVMTLRNSGNVGIGTDTPYTALDVNGTLKIAYGGEACDASREGAIRYTSSDNSFYVCQSVAGGWQKIITADSGGVGIPAGGNDREIQFNSGGDLAGNSSFVFTSAGRLGVGTPTPSQTLDVAGTANVTGATTLGSTLGVTGQVDFSSGLNVANATVLSDTLNVANATTLGSTLDVVGANATTLGGSLDAAGQVDFSSGLNVANATVLSDTLNVTGATTLSDTLSVANATTLNGLLTTNADANLGGLVTFTSSGAVVLPVGNTGARPTAPTNGMIRYNTDNGKYEAYQGGLWQDILTSAVAGGASAPDRGVQFNSGGDFAADAHFTYTSAGDLIVGSNQIDDTGTGTEDNRMYFDVSKGAFRAGSADGTQWDSANVGGNSIAMGYNSVASVGYAIAIGTGVTASGANSLAMGDSLTASGANSLAMGRTSTASGTYSVAIGSNTTSSGYKSVAIGADTTATAAYSTAIGRNTTASGAYSTAIGRNTTASGANSMATGFYSSAGGLTSFAAGNETQALGDHSFAFGLGDPTGSNTNPSIVSGTNSFGIFMGAQDNVTLAANNTMGLFGGKMVIDPSVPATNLSADTALEVAGTLKIGSGGEACDAAREGALQYGSGGSKTFEVCANSANGWEQLALGGTVAGALGDLPDVTTTGVADGNVLLYSAGASSWVPGTQALNDLSDVSAASPTDGQVLTYNNVSGAWESTTSMWTDSGSGYIYYDSSFGAIQLANITGAAAPDGVTYSVALGLNDLTDVSTTGYSDGKVLLYSAGASAWVPGTVSSSGVSAAGSDRQIQLNSAGSFAAATNFVYTSAGDFIVGSYQKDDTGTGSEDNRMFFDVANSAFRAGGVSGTQWDTGSVGIYSAAFGQDVTVSGARSFSAGWGNTVTQDVSAAFGRDNTVGGNYSFATGQGLNAGNIYSFVTGYKNNVTGLGGVAFGREGAVSGAYSVSFSLGNKTGDNANPSVVSGASSFGIFMGAQDNVNLSSSNTMGVFGGRMVIDPSVPATNLSADTALEVNGAIKFSSAGGAACDAAREGALQYGSGGLKTFEVCANSSNGWEALALGGTVAGALGDLSDVTTTGVANGDLLYYSAGISSWVPQQIGFTDLSDTPPSYSGEAGKFAVVNSGETALTFTDTVIESVSGEPAPSALDLGDLGDVTTSGAIDGQFLKYDSVSGEWVAGSAALSGLSDVDTTGFADGNVLLYSAGASAWVPGAVTAAATPAGSDSQIQFNSGGSLGAATNFVYTSAGDFIVGSYQKDDTGAGSEASRMFFDKNKAAFRAGYASANTWDSANVGLFSVAMGLDTTASAQYSIAMGWNTTASANSSTAMGASTTANGIASTAMGSSTVASGSASIAMGSNTLASGNTSMVMGQNSTAAGVASMVIGTNSFASGSSSMAMGLYSSAGGLASFAVGQETQALGDNSFAFGLGDPSGNGTSPSVVSGTNSFGVFMGAQDNVNLSSSNTMGVFGGRMVIDPSVPATNLSADTALEVNGAIKFGNAGGAACDAAREGALQYGSGGSKTFEVCANSSNGWEALALGGTVAGALNNLSDVNTTGYADGNVLYYSAGAGEWVAGKAPSSAISAAGNDTEIQFNNGGVFYTSTGFVFSNNRLGVGTASPSVAVDVTGDVKVSNNLILSPISGLSAPTYISSGSYALNDLTDVNTTGYSDGNVLLYSAGISAWVPGAVTAVATPAGSESQIQFNSGGSFTANSKFVYTSSGSLGLGTSSPVSFGGSTFSTVLYIKNSKSNGDAELVLDAGTNSVNANPSIDFALGGTKVGSIRSQKSATSAIDGGIVFDVFDGATMKEGMTISTTGNVGINKVAPTVALDVVGDIQYTGTLTDISDMRLKKDIVPLNTDDIMKRLAQVQTYTFRMKDDPKGQLEYGVMAQEIEKVFPELVRTANDDMHTKSVNYIGLIAPLVKASQELQAENDDLRAQITEMKTAQNDLIKDVKGLKAYTGYGVGRAEIGLWILMAMFGSLSLSFVLGGMIRNRRNKMN